MPKNTPKPPAYQRIKSTILANIHSGEWTAGSAIPTEMELTQAFGVSRMTVNRALKELTDERVLERRQGSGTFVAQAKFNHTFVEIRNIAEDIKGAGKRYKAVVLDKKTFDFKDLEKDIASRFSDKPKAVHFVAIVHFSDDTPLQMEERWVSAELLPDFLAEDFTTTNTSDYLIAHTPLESGEYSVHAENPPEKIRQVLSMNDHEPALLLTRKTQSKQKVVTVVKMWHSGKRYQFSGKL
ncbi:MAG: GntR family transcriptional regulator [Moraxella sp.]|nr:GntR family transcriptional regulator [Moraxella sp.]